MVTPGSGGRRWLRFGALGAGAAAALALAASFALPLYIRGPRFAAMVDDLLPPMQGSITLASGRVGVGALWALLFGRPIPVRLSGVVIRDPEGTEVFRSAELTTRVELSREPLRVMLHDLRPGKAMWRFSRMKRGGIGFIHAFRKPPSPPRPPEPPAPAGPPAPARPPFQAQFGIASARLDGLDAIFEFPSWGLVLEDIKATGFLSVEIGKGKPPITFDAVNVAARRGGHLRILGGNRATVIPFDRAEIQRIGTPAGTADLLLEVRAAMTGPSQLAGRALFPSLFPGRKPGSWRGLDVDATWSNAGAGLTAAAASRRIAGLVVSGDKAELRAKVKSSFRDIDGAFTTSGLDLSYRGFRIAELGFDLSIVGPPVRLSLDRLRFAAPAGGKVEGSGALVRGGDLRFDLRLTDLGTTTMLPPSLQPLLGGIAAGALAVRGNLGESRVVVEEMDVTLDRERRGPLPERFRMVTGPLPGRAARSNGDQLFVRLGRPAFERGVLSLGLLEATMFGARLQAKPLSLTIMDAAGVRLPRPVLALALSVSHLDLARVLPGTGLWGVLSFAARANGPIDDVVARVGFPARGGAIRVFDQDYRLPADVRFAVRGGDQLTLEGLRLGAPGGGSLVVAGRLVADRDVDLSVEARAHRLDRVPFVSGALRSLGGTVTGKLRVYGRPLLPELAGHVDLAEVTLAGVALGAGAVKLTSEGPGRTSFRGALFGRLKLAGDLRIGAGGPALAAQVDADALTLDPFLPRLSLLRGARLRVGGRFSLSAVPGRPLDLGAALDKVAFGYGCRGDDDDPRAAGCFLLESRGPLRARSRGGVAYVELERARFVAPGSDLVLAGRLDRGHLDASVNGRVGLEFLGPFFAAGAQRFVEASGAFTTSLTARGRLVAPRVTGELEVVAPVRVASRLARLELRVPRGKLGFEPGRVKSPGIEVEALGMKLRLAGEAPMARLFIEDVGERVGGLFEQPLALTVVGSIEAGILPRFLPAFITAARGTATVDAKIDGTPARPRIEGDARLHAMTIDLRPRTSEPKRVRVGVHGGTIVARGGRVILSEVRGTITPGGDITIGPDGNPAYAELIGLLPPTFGRVSVPVVGKRLNIDLGWLRLDDGGLDLLLAGNAATGPLALAGEVAIGAGRVSPGQRPKAAPSAPAEPARPGARPPEEGPPGARRPPPRPPVKLDVRVKSDGERFVVDPGWLPDLHLGFDVRVGGTMGRPAVAWDARGRGIYSAIALFLFKLFS